MNAGFSQEAYQKATRVRLGSFTFPSFSRAGRGAWPAIHALALRGMSARDASSRFSRNFSIQKKPRTYVEPYLSCCPGWQQYILILLPSLQRSCRFFRCFKNRRLLKSIRTHSKQVKALVRRTDSAWLFYISRIFAKLSLTRRCWVSPGHETATISQTTMSAVRPRGIIPIFPRCFSTT